MLETQLASQRDGARVDGALTHCRSEGIVFLPPPPLLLLAAIIGLESNAVPATFASPCNTPVQV